MWTFILKLLLSCTSCLLLTQPSAKQRVNMYYGFLQPNKPHCKHWQIISFYQSCHEGYYSFISKIIPESFDKFRIKKYRWRKIFLQQNLSTNGKSQPKFQRVNLCFSQCLLLLTIMSSIYNCSEHRAPVLKLMSKSL